LPSIRNGETFAAGCDDNEEVEADSMRAGDEGTLIIPFHFPKIGYGTQFS
jgi:hypothetical protein